MSFEIFTEHAVKEEVRQMLLALRNADYAISDLTKEEIWQWAHEFEYPVTLRQLRNGKVKVKLAAQPQLTNPEE